MDEFKSLISGMARHRREVFAQPTQLHQGGDLGNENLGSSVNSCNIGHYTKLEFPVFNGDNLTEWLYKAEKFFEIDTTTEAIKVKLATMHFEGKTLHWFKLFLSTKEKGRMVLWDELVEVLIVRFGEQVVWDPTAEIKKSKQKGSLQQYLDEFDELLSKIDFNKAQALSQFLGA